MKPPRIYRLKRLDEAELGIAYRRGKRCGGGCDAPIVYALISESAERVGPGSRRIRYLCLTHAGQFASAHAIEITNPKVNF